MKKLLIFSLVAVLLSACSGENGELVGVYNKSWKEPLPYGMLYIKRGSFTMGQNDQDANWAMSSQSRTVSVDAFWMDETEITNGEYKQFVNWVVDSIAREKLSEVDETYKIFQDKNGNELDKPVLNYKKKIAWDKPTEDQKMALDSMFYQGEDKIDFMPEMNSSLLMYKYAWVDYIQAAQKENKFDPLLGRYNRSIEGLGKTKDSADVMIKKDTSIYNENGEIQNITVYRELKNRSDFISQKRVNIYPDTLCWIRDYTYAYNEPYMRLYFSHPGYGEYPVVGVSWEQAQAFCHWRSYLYNSFQVKNGEYKITVCQLRLSGSMLLVVEKICQCILGVVTTFVQQKVVS